MKEFFKTKSPYANKEKTDKKQKSLLSSEKKSPLNSKTPSFFDNKESTTQKIPSFMSNDDTEAVAQGKKLAREAIDGNLRRGAIDSAFLQSHPNLFDGLSMFYAHSLSNNKNSKAANEAYKYAYEETANGKKIDLKVSRNSKLEYNYDKFTTNSHDDSETMSDTIPYRDSYRSKQNHEMNSPQGVYEHTLQRIQQLRKREVEEKRKPLKVEHQTQQVFGDNNPGCLLTCISMVYNYFGHETTPEQLYELNGNSYYVNFNNIQNNSRLNEKLAFTMSEKGISENEVYKKCLDELQKGNPVIVEVAYNGGTHSVLVYGYTGDWSKESGFNGSDFLVMDPYRETANKSETDGLNTMQHTVDMFRTRAPKIHRWIVYEPIKEKQ